MKRLFAKLAPIFAFAAFPLAVASVQGCAVDADETSDEADETEPGETAESALSTVDCSVTMMDAYEGGSKIGKLPIIKIGGKNVYTKTANAFLKMQKAANAAGVTLNVNSGFRTMAEQQYFYHCYTSGSCNNGNLAAKPGYSNHQNGRALDLTTSSWLANHAAAYGFKRTVPSEAWHYEYFGTDPGGPCSGGGSAPPPAAPSSSNDDGDLTPAPAPSSSGASNPPGTGKSCSNDGACNPGNDGSGLICQAGKCVPGCHTNAQCGGNTTCHSGVCK